MSPAGHGLHKLGARLPGAPSPTTYSRRCSINRALRKHSWDFDHSELETVRIILCLNLKCCQSRLRNLEVPMLLHADADVCHFENANLEQTATYFGKAVFLEISHAVPS